MDNKDRFADPEYLKRQQYATASNLNARIGLHVRYSTNSYKWHRWVFDQFDLLENTKILEVGCGPGSLWIENRDRIPSVWQITLSDLSEGMLTTARHNLAGETMTFVGLSGVALPFRATTFDAVIANHMLYHLPNIEQGLTEMQRVLKPKGKFFAATNGSVHMAELYDLVNNFNPASGFRSPGLGFDLDNGEAFLQPLYGNIDIRQYPDSLRVTEARPIVDYLLSMSSFSDVEEFDDVGFEAYLEEIIARQGEIVIHKSVGMFIASQPK